MKPTTVGVLIFVGLLGALIVANATVFRIGGSTFIWF